MRQAKVHWRYARIMFKSLSEVMLYQWNPWAATCIG
jgi:hypothetical protein